MSETETLGDGMSPPTPPAHPEPVEGKSGESTPEPVIPAQAGIRNGEEGQGNADKRIRDLQSTADKLRVQVQNQATDMSLLNNSIGHLTLELQEAVTRYRAEILRRNPEIPAEMVTGRCVAEIDDSLLKAQAVVDAVKANLQEQIPAGAPARTGTDVSSLSPRQKIEYGISQGQRGRK